jgi:hypothetical protein
MTDPFDLQRFVDAQAPVYPRVLAELRQGQKQSHWIWFISPSSQALATARWRGDLPSPLARKPWLISATASWDTGFASARRSSMRSGAEQFGKYSEAPTI